MKFSDERIERSFNEVCLTEKGSKLKVYFTVCVYLIFFVDFLAVYVCKDITFFTSKLIMNNFVLLKSLLPKLYLKFM